MDDNLILAVFKYPELYNVTLPNYRCTESRANAWRNISMLLGLPSEECKRKWKNMRDRYLKEVRMEIKSKKQGEIVQSRWKYRQLMNFIAPFTGSRSGVANICSNNDDDQDNPDNESGSAEGETTSSEAIKTPQSINKVPVSQPDLKPQVPFVTQLPSMTQETQVAQLAVMAKLPSSSQITPISKIGRKRRLMQESLSPPSSQSTPQVHPNPTKWLVKDNATSFPNRPRDEDELFLLSFVPALKRLAPQKRCETKIKIQQIMYEAEFNVAHSESQEKPTESETQD
ncbi:transcription factor Adf-1 [Toxotes jaculatrix]|uniref:transcription factor Adf-1 n=1 Tax=Toxotes jaculatrix TaxID=941984 RepID=UPI001B3A8358|nr:transcription factor Adf-1 [Toxotes jaculatrix]